MDLTLVIHDLPMKHKISGKYKISFFNPIL